MSRTIKGKKPAGFEYWSGRPGGDTPGKYTKKRTHKAERRQGKQIKDFEAA